MADPNLDVSETAATNSDGYGEKGTIPAVAMALVGNEARPIDPEIARRVLRKIDMFLMPAMVLGALKLSF
jgi:hypothetical protein